MEEKIIQKKDINSWEILGQKDKLLRLYQTNYDKKKVTVIELF